MYFPNAFSPYIYKKKIPFPPLIKLPKLLIFPLLSACSRSAERVSALLGCDTV